MENTGCPRTQAVEGASYFEEINILTMEIQTDNSEDDRDAS